MSKTQFFQEIDKILELTPGTIEGNENVKDFEQWDSLSVLSFISMADTHFSALVTANDLAKCTTFADLASLFPSKIS